MNKVLMIMKKTFGILLIISCFLGLSLQLKAQCHVATEKDALSKLGEYIQAGRYSSLKMYEGDELIMFKSLNKGVNYRFIVTWSNELAQNVEFEIRDWDNKIIFNNKNRNYTKFYDYICDKSHRIKLIIRVPSINNQNPAKGCVAILTGIKKK